jgi:hypothetical protein
MINFTKFSLRFLNKNRQINSKIILKNYLSTSKVGGYKRSERIDLKEEFQEMLKETQISEEELTKKKNEEKNKKNESIDQANRDFNKQNEILRNEFEKHREAEGKKEEKEDVKLNEASSESSEGNNNKNNKNNKKKSKNDDQGQSEKGPNVISRFLSGFAKVWKQTFPGEENLDLLLEKRKIEAQILKSKIKEATEEEIAEIETSIPEWKRGALILVETEEAKDTSSIFEIARKNLAHHIKSLRIYKETQTKLKDSEISLLMEDFKKSYSNVKDNLKESQNPLFVVSRDLMDRVQFKSTSSQAISIMRKHDPSFELITFEKEVDAIFKQLMDAFFKDKLDIVRSVAGESALAVLTSEIKSRRERVKF